MARPRLVCVTTLASTQWRLMRGQNAYMRDRGFELHAVASPDPLLRRLEERDGLTAHGVPIPRTVAPARDLRALLRLYRLFRRLRPEIVHLSTPKAAFLGALAAAVARVPVRVFLVRGLASENASGARRRLYCAVEAATARLCHRSVPVSPSLLDFGLDQGILPAGATRLVESGMSNGVAPEWFATSGPARAPEVVDAPRPLCIGFVGRLARDKGVEEVWAVWRRLREREPFARLLLVGRWEDEEPVAPSVRRSLEGDPRVEMTGHVEDVGAQYRRMSVLLFPSHGTEGFPNVPMEAALFGVPTVATRVVGCVDAVRDGETGTIVAPGDIDGMVAAVWRYLANPELRRRHGAAARERVRRDFAPEPIWEGFARLYDELLREHDSGSPARDSERAGATLEPDNGDARWT